MDADTVDRQYAALQQQSQQTAALIQTLAGKLSAAASAGDQNAREWQLDLREIALAIRDEEGAVNAMFQGIHALVDSHVQDAAQVATYPPPSAAAPPAYAAPVASPEPSGPGVFPQPYVQQGGGTLHRFLGSNLGRAVVTGAGFGIGDDLINSIFGR